MQNVNNISKLFAYNFYSNMQKATAEAVTFAILLVFHPILCPISIIIFYCANDDIPYQSSLKPNRFILPSPENIVIAR